MSHISNLSFQHRPDRKIHWIQIKRCRRSHLLTSKSWKWSLHQSWVIIEVWVVLNFVERLNFEMLFYLFKSWNQNIISVEVCVDLNPPFHESERWLPRFGDCSPYHKWKRILSAVDCSHGLINDCWRFCVQSVILIINRSFNFEEFLIRKTISYSAVPVFKPLRRIFALSSIFCFWTGVMYCLFLIL